MEEFIIIGGGPSGLSAAIYAGRADFKPLIIEGSIPGGQLMLTTEVENYPGFSQGKLGPELIAEFRKQAERFGTRFVSQNVMNIKKNDDYFQLMLSNKEVYKSKTVLVATGADARWLNLESEQRLRGKGVSACATCDGFFFKNKTVAVLGGGDSAMEEANFLSKLAGKVYLVHRRDTFRASPIMQKRVLENPKIEVVYSAQVEEVLGEDKVTGLKLNVNGKAQNLPVDGVFVAIGHSPSTKFLEGSGVELDAKGYIYTSAKVAMEKMRTGTGTGKEGYNFNYQYMTKVPGIFAAGDCVDHEYRQAAVAAGMGIAAELEVQKYLENV